MASPPLAHPERRWTASPWLPLVRAEIVRSPATQGVVILADERRDPILVTSGIIRDELWRIHRSPRATANRADFFRYIELGDGAASQRLSRTILKELTRTTGHGIARKDFPPLQFAGSVSAARGQSAGG